MYVQVQVVRGESDFAIPYGGFDMYELDHTITYEYDTKVHFRVLTCSRVV